MRKLQQPTYVPQNSVVQISYELDKYSHLYKNDKLHRLILAKIVQSSEKCQTTDFIFFLTFILAPYHCVKICMVITYVFLPHLFSLETSNYLGLNRKTIFQICLLQVQYFSQHSMSTQDQQNQNHNFITFLAQVIHFTRYKLL